MVRATMSPIECLLAALKRADISQAELARLIDKKPGHVWAWINRTGRIPAEMCRPIVRALNGEIELHELRPDLFDAPASQTPHPEEAQA